MGLALYDRTADFSANPKGHVGLYTSITNGLVFLHEMRRSASKSANNSVPSQPDGTVIGAPVYSAGSDNVSPGNGVIFGAAPVSGNKTLACIFKIKNGGTTNDTLFGSIPNAPSTMGQIYMLHYNMRVQINGGKFPDATSSPPLSGFINEGFWQDLTLGDVGNYELFFGILEDDVSVRVYRPKTKVVASFGVAGYKWSVNGCPNFQTGVISAGGAQDIALTGYWTRALATAEMDTMYGELKPQMARNGITI